MTPYDTPSRLTHRDHAPLQEKLAFPRGVDLVIPRNGDRAVSPPDDFFTSYLSPFEYGLEFPFPRLVIDVLWALCIPPAQLVPSAWGVLKSLMELWERYGLGEPTAEEFFYLFRPHPALRRLSGWVTFFQIAGRPQLITITPRKETRWQEGFFFLKARAPHAHPVLTQCWRHDPDFSDFEFNSPRLFHLERIHTMAGRPRPSTGPVFRYRVRVYRRRAPPPEGDDRFWTAEELAQPNEAFLIWLFTTPCPRRTAIEYGIIRRNEQGGIEICHPGWVGTYDRFFNMPRTPDSTPEELSPASSGPGAEPDHPRQEPEFIDLVSSSDEGEVKPAEESPRSEGAYYFNNSVNAYLSSTPIPPVTRQIPAPESSEPPCFRALHYGCSLDNASTIEGHATSSDWLDMGAQLLGEVTFLDLSHHPLALFSHSLFQVAAINNRLVASRQARREEERRLTARCDALNAEMQQIRCRCVVSEANTTVLKAEIRDLKEDIAHHYEVSAEERECAEGVAPMIDSVQQLKADLSQRILDAEEKTNRWTQRDLHRERSRRLEIARRKLREALDIDDVEHLF